MVSSSLILNDIVWYDMKWYDDEGKEMEKEKRE